MKRRVFGATAAAACVALGALTGAALAGDGHGTPPGQAKKQASSQQSKQSGNTTMNNSTGVKPSNTTSKNTHAAAGSNKTKLYGNGTTAGQIATSRGASPNTDLYGPGNSQPHKVAVCKNGKTHYVDVHAVKSYGSVGACKPASATTQATAAAAATAAATGGTSTVTGAAAAQAPAVAATSGVLGARATVKAPGKAAAPRGGVLGATAHTGTLPFTGLSLWVPLFAALALLGAGLGLRRGARSSG